MNISLRFTVTMGALFACLVAGATVTEAQGLHARIHNFHANLFGGANCGRGISYHQAHGLWDNYCYDDCQLSGGHGCGGCGGGHIGGGHVAGGIDSCGCGDVGGGAGGCGCGHRGFLGHHFRRHFAGFRGGQGGGCGCNSGCFGWPSAVIAAPVNAVGRLFHHHRGHGHGGCGCQLGAGSCARGLLGHGLFHHHHHHFVHGVVSRLRGCGCRHGFFQRHTCDFDACSPISSSIGTAITDGCGCNGGSSTGSWTNPTPPAVPNPVVHPHVHQPSSYLAPTNPGFAPIGPATTPDLNGTAPNGVDPNGFAPNGR